MSVTSRPGPAPPGTHEMLPGAEPVRLLDAAGRWVGTGTPPDAGLRRELYRRMVLGRQFDRQATALGKQGALAVYPSSYGQEACQIGATMALRETDWLFPTYRDSVALVARGIDPFEVLTLMRGSWHCGYSVRRHRTAPQCTPLATQCPHAVGLAHAARLAGDDLVSLSFIGDGGTSEGDFHEACNFAAVHRVPTVFLVQNNQYAISVPLAAQTAAPTLAHKAIGYGMRAALVDGNDALAVYTTVTEAVERARASGGPTLIEALTYRMNPHTSADDPTRYRSAEEVAVWSGRDPLDRLAAHLRAEGLLDDATAAAYTAEAEALATGLRDRMRQPPALDPLELFDHVYAAPTPQLREQAAELAARLGRHAS
ncbi:pyruvate dehydrogenase (acetyl-transferring) E1 component subunit alpha [Streptomyces celluloflavus]|uniref:Pyruvate dehydrogenase (Acetyl-transferring) E1 component subunit alpha n=1 Tax=Streptomyces celluloflavus TaxID=58344 RepID=A0ABW7RT25_9ACTN